MGDVRHDQIATLNDVLYYPAVVRDCSGAIEDVSVGVALT